MSYHVANFSGKFRELPERILLREDDCMDAWLEDGEVTEDHWYVPESRVVELEQENARLYEECERMFRSCVEKNNDILRLMHAIAILRKLVNGLEFCCLTMEGCSESCPLFDSDEQYHCAKDALEAKLLTREAANGERD